MAYCPLLFVAILLVATATTTECLLINGIKILQFEILGRVTCEVPSEGAPPESEPVLNGTNVVLDCGGSKKSLAQAVADINGFYKIVYNTTDSVLFDPSTCVVIVGLPIIGCFIYPPVGTLQATLTLVGLLEPVFKAVAIFAAGPLKLFT